MTKLFRLTILTVVITFVFGCNPGVTEPPVACSSDDECQGDVCILGVCIDAQSELLGSVDLEIRPEPGSGLLPQQLRGVSLDTERVDLQLRSTVAVRGSVVGPNGERVLSQIIATPQSGIPQRALIRSTRSEGPQGEFSLELLGDESYAIAIFPDDDVAMPPTLINGTLVVPDGEESSELGSISIASSENALRVSGRVLAGQGAARLGVEALSVFLEDEGKRVSTLGVTMIDGSFSLLVSPSAPAEVTLVVRPTTDNRLTPDLRREGISLTSLGELGDLGEVELGVLPSPIPFAGRVLGPDDVAVANAEIYARAPMGNGEINARFTSDENGNYSSELRPGTYVFVVLPPAENAANAGLLIQRNVELSSDYQGQTFILPERLEQSGTLLDAAGVAVPSARVEFVRLGSVLGAPDDVEVQWRFEALSDEQGAFSARLDAGRYRVTVLPEASIALPRFTMVSDVIEGERTPLVMNLPEVTYFAARLLFGENAIPNVSVSAYAPFSAEGFAPFLLAEGEANESGEVGFILPDLAIIEPDTEQRRSILP